MNLLNDNPKKLFFKFLVPAVSSAVAVAIYSFVDTIVIGQDIGPNGTAACAVLIYAMPMVMNGNGIWWAITAAEGLTAVLAAMFMISGIRKNKR